MNSKSGGARPVPGTEPDQTRRPQGAAGAPELGPDPRLRRRFTKNLLQLLLLRPPEPRRTPAHGMRGHHEGPAWSAATATATCAPSPQPAQPSPRQYPGRRHGRRTQPPPPPVLTSLQGVRAPPSPDEDVSLLVRHIDPHETTLMRDPRQTPTRNPAAAAQEYRLV